ncbi:MAG: sigma-70 family RNA polymerase sigma factor [Anaerolineaceae bacterium]|nr:sigma-70 family RNA polymerase sigma factor [Anaerolineaceae bacterium]
MVSLESQFIPKAAFSLRKITRAVFDVDRSRTMESDTLIKRIHQMDPDALASVHDQFYPVIFRYVHYRIEDDQLVEDITSEVFLRMLDALRTKGTSIRDIRAWLLGTASHMIKDYLRQKYRMQVDNLDDHENLPGDQVLETIAEHDFSNHNLKAAVLHLTDEQQQVLVLRFSMELTLEETAQIMDKSINAVKVVQYRALAALRRLMNEGMRE